MWSSLVFPLAHLNILISAEFSLISYFFFTAQHSELYVVVGLMIVLKTLSFNSTGIFLSHITPDNSFNFIHPILILLLIFRISSAPLDRQEYGEDVFGKMSTIDVYSRPMSFIPMRRKAERTIYGLGIYQVFSNRNRYCSLQIDNYVRHFGTYGVAFEFNCLRDQSSFHAQIWYTV